MSALITYLESLGGDVFKILPMKEDALSGSDNHLDEYLCTLLDNMAGAVQNFPVLKNEKKFIYVQNNIYYLAHEESALKKWRKYILDSRKLLSELKDKYGGLDE